MNRNWFRSTGFAAIVLAFAAASCDNLPTGPASAGNTPSTQSTGFVATATPQSSVVSSEYHFVLANPDNNTTLDASSLIGTLGGTLQVNKHSLNVPMGAVLVPTLFTMDVARNGHIEAELHALLQGLLGLVDVGANGFQKPVTLTFSYANATNVTDPTHLRIALLNGDGTIGTVLTTTLDAKKKTVSAQLPHFSTYAVITD